MFSILVVDDEESLRLTFKAFLSDAGYSVFSATNIEEATRILDSEQVDMIFADILLGADSGMELLKTVKERGLSCPVVMITGSPDLDTASEAVRLGAFDYMPKPVLHKALLRLAERGIKHKVLFDEKERYRTHIEAIFSSVKDGIIAVDSGLNVIAMNSANKDFCGCTDGLLGKPITEAYTHCKGRCLSAVQKLMETRSPVEINRVECQRDDTPPRIVTIKAEPLIDKAGQFLGAVMVKRDETRIVALEQRLSGQSQHFGIVGESPEIHEVLSHIESLSHVDTTVLITGESGCGKELVAAALHNSGPRKERAFVKVNCAALPDDLLASELFGHIKGAFTGAIADRIGRFQQAQGGTIFLDEIGDISKKMQLSLLRVLQEREYERVGESKPIKADLRIIAATNRDLRERVKAGKFRDDLFYRLNVMNIRMPALRERKGDIPLLARHFIAEFRTRFNKQIRDLTADALQLIMEHQWPGNVRELRHAIEHAFVIGKSSVITVSDLPDDLLGEAGHAERSAASTIDAEAISSALDKCEGNKARAARMLGISRRTIYRKIEEFGLQAE